ncbi:RHS repeat protein [Adhaeribacter radiodurans]|uniref:RHS repeat protein n=1 Tax=Adhaeribacter radiodurans TaxID=2745197 RepID=A0A7L7LBC9_9BACT|nr:RHS repeat protein [Adhaeribacter radiodurans]QMU30142.1 RHS repeat protein [Adhaeribacter radiodurans]
MKSIHSVKAFYGLLLSLMIICAIPVPGYGGKCGNDDNCGLDCPCDCENNCDGGNKFYPYTGNVHRVMKDLEAWGSVGEIPLTWMRNYNSRGGIGRGGFSMWRYSFQYDMYMDKPNENGQAQVYIHYPEGGRNLFVKDKNADVWHPANGVDKQLFQKGDDFYLREANGQRYHFRQFTTASKIDYYRLLDIKDSQGNLYQLHYNKDRLLSRVTEPAGRYLQITYSTINNKQVITQVTTNEGRSVRYNYDVYNDGVSSWERLVSVDYSNGEKAVYSYKQSEQFGVPLLEHAVDTRYQGPASNMIYVYNDSIAAGYIREERNGKTGEIMASLLVEDGKRQVCFPNGKVNTYEIAALGKVQEFRDGLGRRTRYTYDEGGTGFIKTIEDALGRVTTYNKRTIYGSPLEITYPDGSKEKWTRDEWDLVLTHTDELDRVTNYTRDFHHRVTRIDYPDGANERFTYNNFGQVLTHIRKNRGIEKNEYDSKGQRISFTDALGNITRYTYNSAGLVASITDARGNTSQQEWDNDRGLQTKITYPDGSSRSFAYDSFGSRTSATDELGHTWKTVFDEFKRLQSSTDPLGRTIKIYYDLPGGICGCTHTDNKPTQRVLPSGLKTEVEYDLMWEKTLETIGAGTLEEATTFYEYDVVGNLTTRINPEGKQWAISYDARNRRNAITDPLGNKTKWTYDAVGNKITDIRPDGGINSYTYDALNRVTSTTDPKGQLTKMTYDAEGNMLTLTDPKNNTYNFTYDKLNRQTRMTYPDGTSERYTYDALGNLIKYTTMAGQVRSYTYDSRNREIASIWTSPYNGEITPAITRTYDKAGRLLSESSSVSTLTYTYNEANERISETQQVAGAGSAKKVSYTYNQDGLLKTITYPEGAEVGYAYTGRNQIKIIGNEEAPLVTYSYDLNGNRILKKLQNGTFTDYTYDAANHLLSLDHQKSKSFGRFDYSYDKVGNRTFVQRDNAKGDVYAYDATDQITKVQYNVSNPGGTPTNASREVNYAWDMTGNRTMVTENNTSTDYKSNNLNQYIQVADNVLSFSKNKNLTVHNGWTYSYDSQNRLVKAVKGTTTFTFAYDPRNRCVKRTINTTITFLYYDKWNLIEERNENDAQVFSYFNGAELDEILMRASSIEPIFYHQDVLGSVTQLTNFSGNVVEKYNYDVFGSPTIKNATQITLATSAYKNRLLFTGRELTQELGLYDFRNRMYSPSLGKFLQLDPIRFDARDYNLYRYVGNNPLNNVDPFGLKTLSPPPDVEEGDRCGFYQSVSSDTFTKITMEDCCPPKGGRRIVTETWTCELNRMGTPVWKITNRKNGECR